MQTINTTVEKCVRFTLTLAPPNNPNSFKALNEIVLNKHPFLENNQRALNIFKVNYIKELTISMYANEIKVEIISMPHKHYLQINQVVVQRKIAEKL